MCNQMSASFNKNFCLNLRIVLRNVCTNHTSFCTGYLYLPQTNCFRGPFNASCLQEFECIVCVEYMHPPIVKCPRGHSYCFRCYEKLKKCPLCRETHPLLISHLLGKIHNYLYIPCKFRDQGCPAVVLGEHVERHEKYCFVNWKRCVFDIADDCTWIGSKRDELQHYLYIHPRRMHFTPRVAAVWKDFKDLTDDRLMMHVMINAYFKLFSCVICVDRPFDLVRWSVQLLGDAKEAERFTFQVMQLPLNPENKENIVTPCGYMREEVPCTMGISYNAMTQYCKNGDFECVMEIMDRSAQRM